MITISPTLARRLAIHQQRLTGAFPKSSPHTLLNTVRAIGCVQLDPISAVARSHQLVLYSRLGHYDLAHLDQVLWGERHLFEYWAHCASIVLTEEYPFYAPMMRAYPWSDRTKNWLAQNQKLKNYVLRQIRKHGPLPSRALAEDGIHPENWVSTGWTSGRNISRMLDFLWIGGKIMVAGRDGIQKLWDLSERVLPEWTPRHKLSERELVRQAAQRALRMLGIATPRHIQQHFLRGRYPQLPKILAELEKEKRVERVEIREGNHTLPGTWYIHTDDCSLITDLQSSWQPRTVLLSPFDNLICDRARTTQMFNFDFRIEIYTPKAKRKYGYYVMPILHGDQIIGRIDPDMDRERGVLTINAVYAEPDAPKAAAMPITDAITHLGQFLGAREIVYNRTKLPAMWKRALLEKN